MAAFLPLGPHVDEGQGSWKLRNPFQVTVSGGENQKPEG